jgi:hypothetical protein
VVALPYYHDENTGGEDIERKGPDTVEIEVVGRKDEENPMAKA